MMDMFMQPEFAMRTQLAEYQCSAFIGKLNVTLFKVSKLTRTHHINGKSSGYVYVWLHFVQTDVRNDDC